MATDEQSEKIAGLEAENTRLLDELEMAYLQLEEVLNSADHEIRVAYDELRKRNHALQHRLSELEQAHVRLQESQSMLLRSERMSAMGQLAATIVHEIKNPLSLISGHVELMLLRDSEHAQKDQLESILQAVWRLSDLTDNILGFARQKPVESQALDPSAVAGQVVDFFMPLIGRRIAVQRDLPPGLPQVCVNPSQIEQVLTNFMMNAMDAVHRQEEARLEVSTGVANIDAVMAREKVAGWQIHLAIDTEPGARQDAQVFVEVRDNGAGVAAETLSQVFDPFFTTKDEKQGTGLGLAICRSIAEDCQGNILMATRAGAGTSLRLFLPPDSES